MADEVISFEIDSSKAEAAGKKSNATLDSLEKKAAGTGDIIVRTFDRSRSSIERLTSSIEKQAQAYGKSGIEKLISQRDQMVQRLGNEKQAVDRVIQSYEKMLDIERRQEQQKNALLAQQEREKAQRLSQQASQQQSQSITNFAQNPMGAAAGMITSMGPAVAAIAAGAAALGSFAVAGYEAAKSLGAYGVEIHNVEVRTGLTAKEVYQFGYAARLSGQDVTIFERMMKGLTTALADTSEKGGKAREALKGLNLRDVEGTLRPTSEILLEVSQRLNSLPNVFERNKAAVDLFKKSGIELAPVMLDLAENVRNLKGAGFEESDVIRWRSYHKAVTDLDLAWEQLSRSVKEPLAAILTVSVKYVGGALAIMSMLQGIATSPLNSKGPGAPPSGDYPGSTSQAARDQLLKDRGPAGSKMLSTYLDSNSSIEGAQQHLKELREAYDAARIAASEMATQSHGLLLPGIASKQISEVQKALNAYKQQSDTVKEIEKDEARRIGNLEKIRDLIREGSSAYVIGKGPLQAILSGQDLFNANKALYDAGRRAPSLRGADQARIDEANAVVPGSSFPGGMQRIPTELLGGQQNLLQRGDGRQSEVFVSPTQERGLAPSEVGLEARGKGYEAEEQVRRARSLSDISENASYAERMVQIKADRDDEIKTARSVASIRQSALDQEYTITGDIERYRTEGLKNTLDMNLKIAETQQRQLDSIKGPAAGLFNTLFTKPREFGKQLGSTVEGAVLKPITEGLGGIVAKQLSPMIFGAGGTGGISGSIKHLFGGGEKADPVVASNDSNTQATIENTAALRSFSMGMAGMGLPGFGGSGGSSGGMFGDLLKLNKSGSGVGEGLNSGGGIVGMLSKLLKRTGSGAPGSLPTFHQVDNGPGQLQTYASDLPGSLGGSGSGAGGPGGISGILHNVTGNLTKLKNSFYNSGSIQMADGTATTAAGIGGLQGALAGVLTSPGMATLFISAGLPLAQRGLLGKSQGTAMGALEGAAGGAMVGAGIGTMIMPGIGTLVGAGVGAAVGGGIGLGEWIFGVQSQEKEAIRLVRSTYRVIIGAAQADQIVSIANQNYQRNVGRAIEGPEVHKLLELYAAGTGQKMPLSVQQPESASLVEQGGMLAQAQTYHFGVAGSFQSNLPVAGGYVQTNIYPSKTSVPLNSAAPQVGSVADTIKQVVTPEFIQAGFASASMRSNGRVQNSAVLQAPGLIVA